MGFGNAGIQHADSRQCGDVWKGARRQTTSDATIAGQPFPHLLFEFVLSFSKWLWACVAFAETFEALVGGVQGALWALGEAGNAQVLPPLGQVGVILVSQDRIVGDGLDATGILYAPSMPASTVDQYLADLPADRRAALTAVRKEINRNLPPGYQEGIQFGMIGWYVPLSMYPKGYGGNAKVPLPLLGLASIDTE